MGTLSDFRTALRLDLADPAGPTQRFSDADLNRSVARAVAELSLASPRTIDAELVLATSSRVVPLAPGSFPSLVEVEEAEWPYGPGGTESTYPPSLRPFRLSPDKTSLLLLTDEIPSAGSRIRVRWTTAHVIAESSTTVSAELDQLLTRGAYAFACLAYSTPALDNFKYDDGATVSGVDDTMIPRAWRDRANEALAEFHEGLAGLRALRATPEVVAWTLPDAEEPLYAAG